MAKTKRELDREIKEILALREQPAPRLPKGRQHSAIAKEQTSPDAPSLRVGQQFDHFGHIYEITKIGRDKNRTVQIARRHRDSFGKEAFIDHRSFPARNFDQQHLRPIPQHSTIKVFEAPDSVAHASLPNIINVLKRHPGRSDDPRPVGGQPAGRHRGRI